MKKQNDWIELFGAVAIIWLLSKVFTTATKAGIGALPDAVRKLIPCSPELAKELRDIDRNEAGAVIRLIIEGRMRPVLKMPLWKKLKATPVTGELRWGQWRIFAYKNSETEFILLSYYKKKQNETPARELEKAESRLAKWLRENKRL